jgi:hypothetical protein
MLLLLLLLLLLLASTGIRNRFRAQQKDGPHRASRPSYSVLPPSSRGETYTTPGLS